MRVGVALNVAINLLSLAQTEKRYIFIEWLIQTISDHIKYSNADRTFRIDLPYH